MRVLPRHLLILRARRSLYATTKPKMSLTIITGFLLVLQVFRVFRVRELAGAPRIIKGLPRTSNLFSARWSVSLEKPLQAYFSRFAMKEQYRFRVFISISSCGLLCPLSGVDAAVDSYPFVFNNQSSKRKTRITNTNFSR